VRGGHKEAYGATKAIMDDDGDDDDDDMCGMNMSQYNKTYTSRLMLPYIVPLNHIRLYVISYTPDARNLMFCQAPGQAQRQIVIKGRKGSCQSRGGVARDSET
jgi:hypothetical protein